jgi:hypothetical protein
MVSGPIGEGQQHRGTLGDVLPEVRGVEKSESIVELQNRQQRFL